MGFLDQLKSLFTAPTGEANVSMLYHVMFREQRQGYPSPKSRFRFSGSVSG